MDNDKIITARIEDKLEQCERGSYITTGFLYARTVAQPCAS